MTRRKRTSLVGGGEKESGLVHKSASPVDPDPMPLTSKENVTRPFFFWQRKPPQSAPVR